MKTFKKYAAQGDIFITRIDALPPNLVSAKPEAGNYIVAHSETGHHHVMDAERVTMYRLPEEIYECFLVVEEPTPLTHLRSFDTHESIMFERGVYNIRRQRERAYTPEGWRRAAD